MLSIPGYMAMQMKNHVKIHLFLEWLPSTTQQQMLVRMWIKRNPHTLWKTVCRLLKKTKKNRTAI
jgi:hypothetical protein